MKKAAAQSHKKKKLDIKKHYNNRGALGAGTAYALLAMLVIMSAGSLMIGNIIPNEEGPTSGQTVILLSTTPEAEKNNLQLYYFPGVTFTPTPSPSPVPQPQNEGGNNWDGSGGSGDGSGSGDGGNNAPDGGSGSGGNDNSGGGGNTVGAR